MPSIDAPIVAVCKTERELGEIVGSLLKNYLQNPFVSARVIEQRSQPFAVIGAVEKPGSFYLNDEFVYWNYSLSPVVLKLKKPARKFRWRALEISPDSPKTQTAVFRQRSSILGL